MSELQFELNLQQITLLKIAQAFWDGEIARKKLLEFWSDESEILNEAAEVKWNNLTKEILKLLKRGTLPEKLERDLLYAVNETGRKIYNWALHIQKSLPCKRHQVIEYVKNICWTYYGTVNEVEVIKSYWLNNPKLDICKVYNMACIYAVEDSIIGLRKKTQEVGAIESCTNDSCERQIYAYWDYYRDADLRNFLDIMAMNQNNDYKYNRAHSIEENMFRLSVYAGFSSAAKFFWSKMNSEERNRKIIESIRATVKQFSDYSYKVTDKDWYILDEHIKTFMFLVNQLQPTSVKELYTIISTTGLNDEPYKGCVGVIHILNMLFIWPWQEFFMITFNDLLEHLEKADRLHYHQFRYTESIMRQLSNIRGRFAGNENGPVTKRPFRAERCMSEGFSKKMRSARAMRRMYPIHLQLLADLIVTEMSKSVRLDLPVEGSRHQAMLHEIWYKIPIDFKQKMADCNFLEEVTNTLIEIWDLTSLKLILNSPELLDRRHHLINSRTSKLAQWLNANKHEKLEAFFEEIRLSAEELTLLEKMEKEPIFSIF